MKLWYRRKRVLAWLEIAPLVRRRALAGRRRVSRVRTPPRQAA
jgi:hypothetical protein